MSLLDRLIEPINDYISFRDFIFHLSSANHEPLYEVVTYLLHHDLDTLDFYNIDTSYKIIKFAPDDFDTVTEFLKEIQKALSFSHEEWVWVGKESLDELRDQDRRALTNTVSNAMHCFFKKSDVLGFEPLKDLLHFSEPSNGNPKADTLPTIELGEYQKILITYELFTPEQITCLLSNDNPAYSHNDDKYNAYKDMVSNAIETKALNPINDKEQIPAEQVQSWLARYNFIIRGFNDNLPNDIDKIPAPTVTQTQPPSNEQLIKELAAAKAEIADLEEQLKQAKAEQADAPADDKELPSKSQAGVARMLYAILTEHGYDLSPMKGKGVANDMIVSAANTHGTSVTRNFVADWLIRAREVKINNTK